MAAFDGGKIEESEVIRHGAIALYELRTQEEALKQQILLTMLKEKLVSIEEKSTGKKWPQLVSEFIDNHYDKASAENAKKYFFEFPSNTSGGNDEENEEMQIKLEIENRYIISLIKKYNVKLKFSRPEPPVLDINTKNQPFWGKADAPLTIVEFSDFECPYCKKMQNDIQKIKSRYSQQIKWVFIDFPLQFHRNAMQAHIAARCAGEQDHGNFDKYFDLQQLLFTSSPALEKADIANLTRKAGLNSEKFNKCMLDKNEVKKKSIEQNIEYGKKLGISGTPTIFINGKYYPGLLDYSELEEIIENESGHQKVGGANRNSRGNDF